MSPANQKLQPPSILELKTQSRRTDGWTDGRTDRWKCSADCGLIVRSWHKTWETFCEKVAHFCRGGSGTSQMGANGRHNSSWGQYAAEVRILLVYLSESLGRLGQNGGPLGDHIFHWGAAAPSGPRRTAPAFLFALRQNECAHFKWLYTVYFIEAGFI